MNTILTVFMMLMFSYQSGMQLEVNPENRNPFNGYVVLRLTHEDYSKRYITLVKYVEDSFFADKYMLELWCNDELKEGIHPMSAPGEIDANGAPWFRLVLWRCWEHDPDFWPREWSERKE